jgi:hypothetical protein
MIPYKIEGKYQKFYENIQRKEPMEETFRNTQGIITFGPVLSLNLI